MNSTVTSSPTLRAGEYADKQYALNLVTKKVIFTLSLMIFIVFIADFAFWFDPFSSSYENDVGSLTARGLVFALAKSLLSIAAILPMKFAYTKLFLANERNIYQAHAGSRVPFLVRMTLLTILVLVSVFCIVFLVMFGEAAVSGVLQNIYDTVYGGQNQGVTIGGGSAAAPSEDWVVNPEDWKASAIWLGMILVLSSIAIAMAWAELENALEKRRLAIRHWLPIKLDRDQHLQDQEDATHKETQLNRYDNSAAARMITLQAQNMVITAALKGLAKTEQIIHQVQHFKAEGRPEDAAKQLTILRNILHIENLEEAVEKVKAAHETIRTVQISAKILPESPQTSA